MRADAGHEALPSHDSELRDAQFAEFFRAQHTKLIRFVMAMGANADDAAEVAQATMVKALQEWNSIRSPRAWTRRVASRRLTAARQSALREAPQETPPDSGVAVSAALAVELSEEAREVLDALRTLPDKQREVMAWTIDGFSAAEIATELRVSTESVRQNLARARKRLNRYYGRREQR